MSDQEISAYRVKVTVRNNLLLTAIEEAGYKTISAFARAIGAHDTEVGDIVGLRKAPITPDGEFCIVAKKIMEGLGAAPTDLWTPEQLTMKLKRNTSERYVSASNIRAALGGNVLQLSGAVEGVDYDAPEDPGAETEKKEFTEAINQILDTLTPREAKVIRMRYGIGTKPMELEQIGQVFGVTRARIFEIEQKSLRKLRRANNLFAIAKTGYQPDWNDDYFNRLLKSSWLRHNKLNKSEDEEDDEPETDS